MNRMSRRVPQASHGSWERIVIRSRLDGGHQRPDISSAVRSWIGKAKTPLQCRGGPLELRPSNGASGVACRATIDGPGAFTRSRAAGCR